MPVARCHFADGKVFEVEADPEESFLEALLRAGAPVRYQCRSGSCLSCACSSDSNGLIMRASVASSMLKAEIAEGRRLCCIGQLQSDDELHFAYRSDSAGPAEVSAFVDAVEWMAPDAVKLRVELAEGEWIDFQPGQYVRLTPPGADTARSYSMCSTPAKLPTLEFMIRVLDSGVMSDYLRSRAQRDDVLTLSGPFGGFTWNGERREPHLFIAGGTGLSPIASIIEQIRATSGRKPPMILSFGCATRENLFADEYLRLLAQWLPTLEVRVSVERGAQDGLLIGNPVTAITADQISTCTHAYICGPPAMIDAAVEKLSAAGVPAEQIHYEQFTASPQSEA